MLSFLMPKPNLAPTPTDADGWLVYFDGDLKTQFTPPSTEEPGFRTRMILKAGSKNAAGKKSNCTPPYHWHWYQTETFQVNSGKLAFKIDGKEGTLGAGETISTPPGKSHTFWLPEDSKEDLDVTVITEGGGERPGFDEYFVRNLYGYLNCCRNTSPNPLQLFTFFNSADVVLGDLPFGIGRALNYIFGAILGPYVFGLKPGFKVFETSSQ